MNKLFIALACATALFAVPATAQVRNAPAEFEFEVVYVDKVHARPAVNQTEVFVTDSAGTVFDVIFQNCDIKWYTNEQFYFVSVNKQTAFLTPKAGFDTIHKLSNYNFNVMIEKLINTNKICEVVYINDNF